MDIDDAYCIKIKRFGALGLEEEAGRLNLHAREREEIKTWIDTTLLTLGPGDRAEITLTRGHQAPEAAKAATLYEQLAQPAPERPPGYRSGVDGPPLPGDDHPEW